MSKIDKVRDIVNDFEFKKGDYVSAEEQFSKFADSYVKLSADEVEILRSSFDAKDRLGWLRIASTLFCKSFSDADNLQKDKLCNIFFALYSFDNMEFGFDSVIDVISVSDQMKNYKELAKKKWDEFKKLTSNDGARNNIENKIFAKL